MRKTYISIFIISTNKSTKYGFEDVVFVIRLKIFSYVVKKQIF